MYSDELFDQKLDESANEWNKIIVPYYNNFLGYIKNCDPRSPMPIFEEQIESNQIFPDTPIYHTTNFV